MQTTRKHDRLGILRKRSRLDKLETSARRMIEDAEEQHGPEQERLASRLLKDAWLGEHFKRTAAIAQCGTRFHLARTDDTYRIINLTCKDRLCKNCNRLRSYKIRKELDRQVTAWQKPKFLTLTLRTNDLPLRDQIQRITKCFKTLRDRAYWKRRVTAGIWAVEVTRNQKTDAWHVHIHVLINAVYLDKSWLTQNWLKITGDSFIVDIKKLTPAHTKYVAKYASKGIAQDTYAGGRRTKPKGEWRDIWEVAHSLKGLRLMGTFADAEKLQPDKQYEDFALLDSVQLLLTLISEGETQWIEPLEAALANRKPPPERPPARPPEHPAA